MIKMLWEKCLPKRFYDHVKTAENFTLLNSGKISFKQAKGIVHSYVQMPDIWQEMLKYLRDYHSNYQHVYSLLFPKNYLQNSKYGIKSRNNFALCFEEWQREKMSCEIGKNPFNFTVPDVNRHPYEQMPIKDDFKVEQILLHPAEKCCCISKNRNLNMSYIQLPDKIHKKVGKIQLNVPKMKKLKIF